MVSKLKLYLAGRSQAEYSFGMFAAITLLSVWAAIASELYVLAGLPALLLLAYVAVVNFRWVFYLLLAFIPLSTEVHISPSLATDLPTEPLIAALMLVAFFFFALKSRELSGRFLRHPITLLLLLHLGWVYFTTLSSELFLVSFKFALAKTWYVATFFFLGGWLLRGERDIKWLFWLVFIPLMVTVVIINIRHAGYGFSFADVNRILSPFQRNHVNYAATMTLFFPFVVLALGWYRRGSLLWWLLAASLLVLLVAIWFTFTRAAFVSLVLALGAWAVLRLRLVRPVLLLSVIVALLGIANLLHQNQYLDYTPSFDRTITHSNFNNLIAATSKLEDISTMERVYRWVAGLQMVQEHPVLGFGPGNFTKFYRSYTVTSFQTYVSDNPEDSGIHSYFFMVLVEQGAIGLLIFLAFIFGALLHAERIYHQCTTPGQRRLLLMAYLCLVVILSFLLINDLIETDKVGSFFFLSLAILVNVDLANQRLREAGG